MFGVRGYPTVWFVSPVKQKDGRFNIIDNKLGSTGYVAGGPTKWISVANQFLKKK